MKFDSENEIKEYKLYSVGKVLAKSLCPIVYREFTVKGKENIPVNGSVIIASNHIAFSDPAVILAHCPRTVHFMAKSELFENTFKAFALSRMGAFPVKRNHFDRNALRHAKKILESGGVLGIFPEGRRVKNSPPSDPKRGVGYIAKMTCADVLPVCLYRSLNDASRWHRLVLSFGKVIKNDEFDFISGNKVHDIENASNIIMNRIKILWEAEDESYGS